MRQHDKGFVTHASTQFKIKQQFSKIKIMKNYMTSLDINERDKMFNETKRTIIQNSRLTKYSTCTEFNEMFKTQRNSKYNEEFNIAI